MDIWERQKGEDSKHYQAFNDYMMMNEGERSLSRLAMRYKKGELGADIPTKSVKTLEVWSVRYEWQERLNAYVAEQADKARSAKDAERLELIEWSSDQARAHLRLIYNRVDEVSKWTRGVDISAKSPDGKEIQVMKTNVSGIRSLNRLFMEVEQFRRLTLNMPTEIIEERTRDLSYDDVLKRINDAKRDLGRSD